MANIEIMLQDAEDEHEEMKKGLDPEDIRKLKLFTYGAVKKAGEEDVCSICLIPAATGDKIFELGCSHIFHHDCITPWFKKSS